MKIVQKHDTIGVVRGVFHILRADEETFGMISLCGKHGRKHGIPWVEVCDVRDVFDAQVEAGNQDSSLCKQCYSIATVRV